MLQGRELCEYQKSFENFLPVSLVSFAEQQLAIQRKVFTSERLLELIQLSHSHML